ncbi:MAG: DUF2975 domain-containing protein [Paludibacter sp.]|nr:DUF2975 domain-containing protein [Paludibacter sp.]
MERLKTLCIVLLIIFFASMYQGAVLPFIEGFKYGLTIAEYETNTNVNTQEFLMMDVEPKSSGLIDKNEINLKNGQPLMVRANNVSVIMNNTNTQPLWWMIMNATYMAFSIIVLILGIWIPFLVVKIIRSLQHSLVFERINLVRINRIGLILLGIGILGSVIQIINILSAEYLVELTHYRFTFAKSIDFNALIMGIVILIMTEVMRIAIEMKEEQDLTI